MKQITFDVDSDHKVDGMFLLGNVTPTGFTRHVRISSFPKILHFSPLYICLQSSNNES